MYPDYIQELPLPDGSISPKLRTLLEPPGLDPLEHPEVTCRYEVDRQGPDYEYVHMLMALTGGPETLSVRDFGETTTGVVNDSTPIVAGCGGLAEITPSVSGHEYIVASSGSGSFFAFNLAEKVWMTLGLSPRCVGGKEQKMVFDDLSLPVFGVAEGEISSTYNFQANRNVSWRMSNEYLRDYLWMRGKHGTRVFFYETNIAESSEITEMLGAKDFVEYEPENGWYRLQIMRGEGRPSIKLWAVVCAIPPVKCDLQTVDSLAWPGVSGAVNSQRANALLKPTIVYLDDRFLVRYEQNSSYDTTPIFDFDFWSCSPSYLGQWSYSGCRRVGRNLVKVDLRDLYEAKPSREIIWAHSNIVAERLVNQTDLNEEHIVAKVQRFLDALLGLADGLAWLVKALDVGNTSAEDLIGFSRKELASNGWLFYPKICRLAQVAPLDMTEQLFLARCKELHEMWQKIPNVVIRQIIQKSGYDVKKYKDFGSLKLIHLLTNILEGLNINHESVSNFDAGCLEGELTKRNDLLKPLFLTADLRNADAHGGGTTADLRNADVHSAESVAGTLIDLDFDISLLNDGYGSALDHVFDQNIAALNHVVSELTKLQNQSPEL